MAHYLNTLLEEANADARLPAVAAAGACSSGVLAAGAIGVTVLDGGVPVHAGSRFHIGSITKSITATAIATLVEDGVLTWTTRPTDVFPELAPAIHPALREVELQHLLSHRAGIAPYDEDEEIDALPLFAGSPAEQRAAFTAHLLRQEPAATPLADHLYSNAGYAIAGAMAERATGVAWDEMVRRRVFEPLHLDSAGFGWPAAVHEGEPWGHRRRGAATVPHSPTDEYRVTPLIAPAGDVHMSMLDLVEYARTHLRGLRGENTIVQAATMKKLHTPFGTYSLGWNEGEQASQHSGSAGTFCAFVVLFPGDDRCYVVATNACEESDNENESAHIAVISSVLRGLRASHI
jgi:CubicO group peptidase (beta-lactamase class C family)